MRNIHVLAVMCNYALIQQNTVWVGIFAFVYGIIISTLVFKFALVILTYLVEFYDEKQKGKKWEIPFYPIL